MDSAFSNILPFEIWTIILKRVIESDISNLASILLVNRIWRQVVEDLLTSSVQLPLVLDHEEHFRNVSGIRLFLKHSGVLPLDVRMVIPAGLDNVDHAINLLRRDVERFRAFDLTVWSHELAETVVAHLGRGYAAPLLEKLKIRVHDLYCPEYELSFAFHDSFTPSPRLTHLTLPARAIPLYDALTQFTTITSLSLDARPFPSHIPIATICSFLKCLPQLQHFRFSDAENYECQSDPLITFVPMPNLISIDITVSGAGLDLIRIIYAPLLNDLRWDGQQLFGPGKHWPVKFNGIITTSLHYLSQSSPLINRLEMIWIPMDDWVWLLRGQAFGNLEILKVNGASQWSSALQGIRPQPSLKRLELNGCADISGELLLDFVQGCRNELEVVVVNCPKVSREDIARLSRFV